MKKLLLLIIVLLAQYHAHAQMEATEQKYLVTKITDETVQELDEVLEIQPAVTFNKYFVSWKMSDMIFQRLSFTYQHILGAEGKIAIYMPVSVFFGDHSQNADIDYSDYYPFPSFDRDESDYYIGLGAKIFPMGQKKSVDFYIGTEVRFGQATSLSIADMYDDETSYESVYEPVYTETSYYYSAFLINPGVSYEMLDRFVIGAELGLGIFLDQSNSLNTITLPVIMMGVSF